MNQLQFILMDLETWCYSFKNKLDLLIYGTFNDGLLHVLP